MAKRIHQDRNVELKEEYVDFTAGEKDREWQCQEHQTTPRQKGQYGEIDVAKWSTKKKANTDHSDVHLYFTNIMAVIQELKEENEEKLKTF
jgi:hypothetical protein